MKFAKRLDAVPPYLFAELERKVSEAEKAGVDVISLGIGDPDLPTPPAVSMRWRKPRATRERTSTRRTTAPRSSGPRRRASTATASASSSIRHGEVIPVLGGKEGVGHIALALPRPGRRLPGARPRLPAVHIGGPVFAGATVHYLPLREENGFLPDLDGAPDAPSCSTSTTRTTRPARPPSSTSSSTRSSSPASAT